MAMATHLLDCCSSAGAPGPRCGSGPCSNSTSSSAASAAAAASLASAPPSKLAIPRCVGLRRSLLSPPVSKLSASIPSSSPLRKLPASIVCEHKQETLNVALEVTDKTWKELVLDSNLPVLVDFWAPWCGPCRMIAPLVDDLAREYAGRVKFLKINTDESPNTATEYGVRSIPTVMIFKQGVKKDSIIGAVPKAALITAIEKFLD